MDKLNELLEKDVNNFTEKKNGLTYLSWANAWKEFLKVYPTATYTIKKDENGVPCFGNDIIGYMVYTTVTVEELTHEMWLPVMDNFNKSMKGCAYEYQTRNGKKTVQPMTMFDVNKAVMRCLTKNLAMFGLGLYIYAGEDLPEQDNNNYQQKIQQKFDGQEVDARHEIYNLLESGKVPSKDKEDYIARFKANPSLVNQKTVVEIKAKYFG